MSRPLKEGATWAVAFATALPAFLIPLYNPDLFWHLSAGRWICLHGALPCSEFLSFSAPGKPWLDFEWLSQLLFYGTYSAGGFFGLWLLKIALVFACWLVFDLALRENEAGSSVRAGGLALWALGALAWSDIRPELFSLLGFSLCLWRLEAVRLERLKPSWRLAAQACALFGVWANLHAGFPFALILIAIYAGGELASARPRRALQLAGLAAAGAVSALANPYGTGPYRVAFEHFKQRGDLERYIAEWRPMSAGNPIHWPFYALLALVALALCARLAEPKGKASWTKPLPWVAVLACGYFGASALRHGRVGAYFGIVAALVLALAAQGARGWLRRVFAAAFAAAFCFTLWLAPRLYWKSFFNDKFVPRRAAEFMARQEPALAPLRLFNQWEWGGYLAWRLRPWLRVFSDGRYIFHDLLSEESRATSSPETWQEFLSRRHLDGALVPNRDSFLPSTRRYPDGSTQSFQRPWYLSFFPRERWALVYWDDQALLFVDRAAVSKAWLAAQEYRWLRPRDDAAFKDAHARGEIPWEAWQAERTRHDEQTRDGALKPD